MGEEPEEDRPQTVADDFDDDGDAEAEETAKLVDAGPRAGNRSGALAFLAFLVLAAAALHFYLAETGSGAYIHHLDAELRKDAGLALAAMEEKNRIAIVPSWPHGLYAVLHRDILVYVALSALAAYVWGLSARARARRDAFLVHEKLVAEIADLRRRLDRLDPESAAEPNRSEERKG